MIIYGVVCVNTAKAYNIFCEYLYILPTFAGFTESAVKKKQYYTASLSFSDTRLLTKRIVFHSQIVKTLDIMVKPFYTMYRTR